ncbi:hypothetical protein GJAV_G00045310 [Gymnothorax javanicus]|nr:hypothetical protein GJAV_G00045310 [Gymnothorax javanicus]
MHHCPRCGSTSIGCTALMSLSTGYLKIIIDFKIPAGMKGHVDILRNDVVLCWLTADLQLYLQLIISHGSTGTRPEVNLATRHLV